MPILIKNPEVDRKVRELAARRGQSLTAAVENAVDRDLAMTRPAGAKLSAAEILEMTKRFREEAGGADNLPPVTRADFDALWEDEPKSDLS